MNNFLDQLSDDAVPEMPGKLKEGLHDRINNVLLAQQIFEVLCGAIPYTFFQLLQAFTGAVSFSLTGRYPQTLDLKNRDTQSGDDDANRPNPNGD